MRISGFSGSINPYKTTFNNKVVIEGNSKKVTDKPREFKANANNYKFEKITINEKSVSSVQEYIDCLQFSLNSNVNDLIARVDFYI